MPDNTKFSFLVPCGKCLYCRIQRRKEWTIRLTHERDAHQDAAFVTLTYKDEELPKTKGNDGTNIETLRKTDLQKFMKRLRRNLSDERNPGGKRKVKYYGCGEYGGMFGRPHYHLLIFGIRGDKEYYETIWKKGVADVGEVEPNSIRYCAQYIDKKIYGKGAEEHYNGAEPEFQVCSQGIGQKYIDENKHILWDDHINYKGEKIRLPRYYQKKLFEQLSQEQKENYNYERQKKSRIDQCDKTNNIFENGGNEFHMLTPDEKQQLYARMEADANQMDLNLKAQAKLYSLKKDK